MSRATGRTANARDIVLRKPDAVEIAIPSHSITEARIALRAMSRLKRELVMPFAREIDDVGRDSAQHAKLLVGSLANAQIAMDLYLQDCDERLADALSEILEFARVFNVSAATVAFGARVLAEAMDDLMLGSVLEDAEKAPLTAMAILSEDKGFRRPTIAELLNSAGIEVFGSVEEVLVWYSER